MNLYSTRDTKNLSVSVSKIISKGDVILLYGDIGVGKTTFVRFLINHLENKNGIRESEVLSPTFNIVYDYEVKNVKILHYDLYRLKSYKDIVQLGMFETSKDHIKIVEWPELIESKPKDRIDIRFQYSKLMDSRQVEIIGFGKWKEYDFFKV
ncbi:MAG: tRNA (adenosine(37)-N6)-threonylcarbamoyltransferase complex ATPase subunit type 1 TsaE [Pelagibacteraceae bacterium]|jgi:tRNA threonylcarbamoyladenosine biosynthesis protein TsaE|nr:tRNA (adenosine(37)-N6)-threonylcarbamoyltransferase complex ATPase subunit type 1 TsaE [Pelagibacteraceae bacterium]MDP6709870.1 tRNA (adenosine(37)-N6)-threonylcarbamoyltransferase complex ATPase subunit type 1 TsaE [Pelagibacteraceae bacterium]|tara:strand:- start:326 stop:781 length:456 start_codon:yes stop_codon:yes gene_type:complete